MSSRSVPRPSRSCTAIAYAALGNVGESALTATQQRRITSLGEQQSGERTFEAIATPAQRAALEAAIGTGVTDKLPFNPVPADNFNAALLTRAPTVPVADVLGWYAESTALLGDGAQRVQRVVNATAVASESAARTDDGPGCPRDGRGDPDRPAPRVAARADDQPSAARVDARRARPLRTTAPAARRHAAPAVESSRTINSPACRRSASTSKDETRRTSPRRSTPIQDVTVTVAERAVRAA